MKILIIGGGNMGLTFAKSFLKTHIVTSENMLILEKSMKKAEELKKLGIGTVYGEAGNYIKDADLIILAVKPQDTDGLFSVIKEFIDPIDLPTDIPRILFEPDSYGTTSFFFFSYEKAFFALKISSFDFRK